MNSYNMLINQKESKLATEAAQSGFNVVFVVGCPRSGTTWVQRLLASHPKIFTGQESHLFSVYLGPQLRNFRSQLSIQNRGGVGLACYFEEKEFLEIVNSYMNSLMQPQIGGLKEGELFLEKSPSHGLFIPEIVELLPGARIIHVLRDPRDVIASLLAASHSWGSNWAPNNARAAARYWLKHVSEIRKAAKNLPHWQYLEIRYEDLHTSTERVLEQCREFLDIEWMPEEISLAVAENDRSVIAKGGGTEIPLGGEAKKQSGSVVLEPEGFVRTARPGEWTKDIKMKDRLVIWKILRRTRGEFGYQWRFWNLLLSWS